MIQLDPIGAAVRSVIEGLLDTAEPHEQLSIDEGDFLSGFPDMLCPGAQVTRVGTNFIVTKLPA